MDDVVTIHISRRAVRWALIVLAILFVLGAVFTSTGHGSGSSGTHPVSHPQK